MPLGDLATTINMTAAELEAQLDDSRGWSALHLSLLADRLGTSLHWMATGERDPFELKFISCHNVPA